jgi:hypothetical protein
VSERTTPLIKLDGVPVGRGRTFDFHGTAITSITVTDSEADITIDAGGGPGGSAHEIQEDGTPVADETVLNFTTGLDVTAGVGETVVAVDVGELGVITAVAFDGNVE